MEDKIYDVVICGAGVAGLSSAYKMLKANKNLSICVVEARDRVGGRTHTVKKGDMWCDVGGQWFGKQQKLALGLIRELGLELFTQYDDGDYVLQTENGVTYYDPFEKQNPLYAVDLLTNKAQMLADNLSPEGYYEGKWTREEKQLDSIMFSEWLAENQKEEGVGEFGVAATSAMITSAIACEPEEYSFLFFLSFLKSGKDYRTLIAVKDGVQEFRIKGGAQRISIELQKFVEKRGCRVMYDEPVKSIANTNGTVLVTTRNGTRIRARHAVCAVPMNLVPTIEFSPPLPLERQQLCEKAPMGSAIKCIFFYKTAFWREKGISANTVSLVPPITNVFDAGDEFGKYPALVCFLLGKNAKQWSQYSEERRRQDVADQLADLFGEEAHDYVDYIEKNWLADEFSKGCYFCVPSVGVLSNYGFILRKPHGHVHFAGTETAKHWLGYIEGAIESGYRCAEEILNKLENASKL